ncbi:MAG: helix-turn-helix domain-containing protein [Aromatoleum sp.]|jgi:AraC family ethanolamine operon transcriptional activator|uniref:helix-turn-helix domain-containing protein n=1 Tax=Aromatoleum sp. TaxID=2307007 RepID=UPI00289443F9|nr:helix-turn-helix domain-containing protein [Aromatoleum sp.]MDT3669250.1 helix-turn-helix domain-containing protein [Aromatoleum sp.]
MEALSTRRASEASATAGDDAFSVVRLATSDADDHASCLQHWRQRYDQLSAGAFAGKFDEFWFDNIQIFRERTNQVIHEIGFAWDGSRAIGVPVEADGSGWYCGETCTRDSLITLRGGDELDYRTPRVQDIVAVTTDARLFNDYAVSVEHRDIEAEIGKRRVLAATPDQVSTLRSFLLTVMASLEATPALLRHAQMRKGLEQAIYGSLIAAINDASDTASRCPTAGRARQLIVDRAREYMRAHIDEPITVADLCTELKVSRRTLQYSFQDILNLNPVSFLRAMRLNGVRRALKNAAHGQESVADIAARWGFWHLSHFAADYKTMFGELPSDTLRHVVQPHPASAFPVA